jgi:2-aminoethylphosphonate-pyruvate transaminase
MTRSVLPKKKWVLLNPGPVNVSDRVRQALLNPDICHREPEFLKTLSSVRDDLTRVFGIHKTHEAALFAGSGTLAVEAMLSSAGHAGEKFLVLSNGVYGERMAEILKRHRIAHHVLRGQGLAFPDLKSVEVFLKKNRSVTAIAMVHHETSTGYLNPLESVARLAKKHGLVVHVDAVSSLGAELIPWHLPIAYAAGASGKCLHGFPGVAFVLTAKSEIPCLIKHPNHSLYLDLGGTLAVQRAGGTPFTPSVQLVYALKAALDELAAETVTRRVASYQRKSETLRKALEASGITILAPAGSRSHVLTAAHLPAGVAYEPLHDWMRAKGFLIYAGQAQWKNRIFRLANLGLVSEPELKRAVALVKQAADLAGKKLVGRAILLAAGVGRRFGAATKLTPKCLLQLPNGGTLLQRYLDSFRAAGIRKITIVVGHQARLIKAACRAHGHGLNIRFRTNRRYRLGSIVSLWTARQDLGDGAIVMDADVYFPADLLNKFRQDTNEAAFLMDPRAKSTGEEMMLQAKSGRIVKIAKPLDPNLKPLGEATGFFKMGPKAGKKLSAILDRMVRRGTVNCEYEDAYCELMKTYSPACVPVGPVFWTEIDFPSDLQKISKRIK